MATTYQWVRHLGTPTPYTGITGAIGSPFAAYLSDSYFGVRTVINPLPTTFDVNYTWRSQVYRDSLRIFDIEWRYRRDSSFGPMLHGRNYDDSGVPGGWVDMTSVLAGMPSGMLILDSAFRTSDLDSVQTELVEAYFPGTTQAQYEYREDGVLVAGGIGTSPGVLGIGGFDIRALAIKNLRAEKFITDLASEENTINFKADIYALPGDTDLFPAWTPVSNADYIIQVWDPSGSDIRHEIVGTATVSAATPQGKVAEIVLAPGDYWDGTDMDDGQIIEGMSLFIAQTAADNPDGIPTLSISGIKENALLTYQCCSCNNGCLKMSMSGSDSTLSYTGHNYENVPASLGYGWSSEASSRIIDQAGELIFKSSSGGSLRWVEDSPGVYIPFSPGNYIKAEVDSGSISARYKLTFRDQTVYEFDATTKRLQKTIDRNGFSTSYSYDVNGHLETISDSNGRSHHFTNRGDGQPLTLRVNDPVNGRLTQFFYYSSSHPDSPDRLQKIVDPEGNETQFFYYPNGPLWYVVDPQGKISSLYGYDNFGRILAEISYGEMRRDYVYGTTDSSLEIVEQDLVGSEPNRARKMFFDKLGNTVLALEMVDPDDPGGPVINETEFRYEDPYNPYLLTKRIDPDLVETIMTYTEPEVSDPHISGGHLKTLQDKGGFVTTYTYAEELAGALNPKHRNLVVRIERPTVTVEGVPTTYDPTELFYDANGNLERVLDPSGQEMVMTYDTDGKVLKVENRLGHVTVFEYEGLPFNSDSRNLIEVKIPKGDTILDGFRSVFLEYDDYDNVIEVRDALGNKVVSLYDGLDRVEETKVLDPLNVTVGGVTSFEYLNTLLEKVIMPANNGSSGLSRKTLMVYDDVNRLEGVFRDVDSLGTQQLRVGYGYTGFSQMSALARMKAGNPVVFRFEYDRLGRPIISRDPIPMPDTGVSTVAYQPFCSGNASTNARGVRRHLTLDARCLPLTLEAGDAGSSDDFDVDNMREFREWEHDQLGRLVRVSQSSSPIYSQALFGIDLYGANAEERFFVYDEMDRLRKMVFEDGSEMFWDYDFEGNVTRMVDPLGKVTRYTYFRDNLLKEVIIERGGEPDRVFSYFYDLAGRLERIEYPEDTEVVLKFDDGTDTSGSGWDAKGQLLHLRYEKDGDLLRRFEFSYDASGNRQSMLEERSDLSAVKWEYGYDWLDRLESVRHAEALSVGALPSPLPLKSTFTYDESDNRETYRDEVNGLTYRYVLDEASNITEVYLDDGSNPEFLVETFTVDEDGNVTSRTKVATGETIHYEWDDFDRLRRVRSAIGPTATSTVSEHNRYDANGLRKRKLDKNGNSSLEFSAGITTASSMEGTENSVTPEISYIQGHQMLGAEVNGSFQYFLVDALGSVRDFLDDSGDVIQSYEFDEHGIPMPGSGASSGTFSPKTYQGALSVNDDRNDSGLYLMGHRHYAPDLGRFISRDPIGFNGGLHLFNGANPVNRVDPSGLMEVHPMSYPNGKSISPANCKNLFDALANIKKKVEDLGDAPCGYKTNFQDLANIMNSKSANLVVHEPGVPLPQPSDPNAAATARVRDEGMYLFFRMEGCNTPVGELENLIVHEVMHLHLRNVAKSDRLMESILKKDNHPVQCYGPLEKRFPTPVTSFPRNGPGWPEFERSRLGLPPAR